MIREPMEFFADLHVHSRFSRATSKTLGLESLYAAARRKGIFAVATGDCLHPAWLAEIETRLEPAEPGLFRLKPEYAETVADEIPARCREPVRFVLQTEISNIYKRDGATRKNHNLVYLPDIPAARRLYARLDAVGNLDSDGRPILGLDVRDLLEIVLEVCPEGFLVPAHIWTPWFSVFGSKSGFDSLESCFRDLSGEIFAAETGLSSDPPMNWRVSELDRRVLLSNSDAHSAATLGRNANRFRIEPAFAAIREALRAGDPARCLGTIDMYPEEGKYHMDGHRNCGVWLHPAETRRREGRCPVCEKPLTVGVLHRVEALADRPEGRKPDGALPCRHIVPLPEILSELLRVGSGSKTVARRYHAILEALGPELPLLLDAPLPEIEAAAGPELAEAIRRMRAETVRVTPGFDGQYGRVRLFDPRERPDLSGQRGLFPSAASSKPEPPGRNRTARPDFPDSATLSASSEPEPSPAKSVARVLSPDRSGKTESNAAPDGAAADETEDPLAGLDEAQRAAATHLGSPLLIVAGPGSGKTRTLTRRAAWLIRERDVPPESVLAITFTVRAAREMRERIAALLGPEREPPPIFTFHAFGLEFLRSEQVFPGALLDAEARAALIREARKIAGVSGNPSAARIGDFIGRAKSARLRPGDDAGKWTDFGEIHGELDDFRAAYAAYQGLLEREGALDFDDLVLETADRLARRPEVRDRWRGRIAHLLVDEYQDLDAGQYRMIRLLSPRGEGLCVIGDPDQSIYGFRGSDFRYFARFAEDYPDARTIRLDRNYRSTETILSASRQLLGDGFSETVPVRSDIRSGMGGPRATLLECATEGAEATAIGRAIEAMIGGSGFQTVDFGRADPGGERSFSDIAVLYRSHEVGRGIREALESAGIPCQTARRTSGFAHPVLRPVLSALRLLSGVGVFADLPPAASLLGSGPGPGAIAAAATAAREAGLRVAEALEAAANPAARTPESGRDPESNPIPRIVFALEPLARALERIREAWAGLDAADRLDRLAEMNAPGASKQGADAARAFACRTAAAFGDDLAGFLRAAALHADPDALEMSVERVSLLTLHAAKGLEFPVVFIAGCEDGLLPFSRPGALPADPAEERRLLYVGATRAREALFLSWARRRTRFGRKTEPAPSPFLRDLEDRLLHVRRVAPRPSGAPERKQLGLFATGGDFP